MTLATGTGPGVAGGIGQVRDRARGCLLGGALGDALGGPVEFLPLRIIRQWFPDGVELDDPGLITDDTQMTLFTADGLIRAAIAAHRARAATADPTSERPDHAGGEAAARKRPTDERAALLWAAYQRWLLTQGPVDPPPDTDDWLLGHRGLWAARAPGNTCVTALRAGRPGRTDERINHSKGCGGVMRAAPAGFLPDAGAAYRAGCQLAALTHGHPTGWLAGGALALLVHLLAVADQPLTVALLEAERTLAAEPEGGEVRAALAAAVDAARRGPGRAATVASLGEGWVAEEALAIAVYAVASRAPIGDPDRAAGVERHHGVAATLRLAVEHAGDSDSTGAIAGNLLGAMLGGDALPTRWLVRLELADLIGTVADDLVDAYFGDPVGLADRYPC